MGINILDLNDDCIASILRYLPFANHMSFAQVCQRFHSVWQDHKLLLYKRLELGATSTADGLEQEVLLLRHIATNVKNLSMNIDRHFAWSERCKSKVVNMLQRMLQLERVILWIDDKASYESFEVILQSLEHLPNIKGIASYQDNEIVDNLYQFSDFTEFLLESEKLRDPLIEIIKSHTKILVLSLRNASMKATLANLVQHSTCIKELSFRMIQSCEEYTPLADLPNLEKLHIQGYYQHQDERPTLIPFLTALASNQSQQLHSLIISDRSLNHLETLQIVRLKGLELLECSFTDCSCLELLSQLQQLTHLFLQFDSYQNMDSIFLRLLAACANLQVLKIYPHNLSPNIIAQAFNVLQKFGDEKKNSPLILMLGENKLTLDEENSQYLTVYW